MPLTRGEQFGGYQIVEEIGRGGMATVYRARQSNLGRDIALKVLFPHLAADPVFVKRFRQEAQIAARLNHPNIVTIYDVGESEGLHYIAMEFIHGPTLKSLLLQQGALDPIYSAQVALCLARALEYAHVRKVFHRDVKPANVLLQAGDGRVVLTDFGVARAADEVQHLTNTGMTFGTPAYMAPELLRGDSGDHRSDLYSLGITLHEMVAGAAPFSAPTLYGLIEHQIHRPPSPLRSLRPEVPEWMEGLVLWCLRKDPDRRCPSAQLLARDLEACLRGQGKKEVVARLRAYGVWTPEGGQGLEKSKEKEKKSEAETARPLPWWVRRIRALRSTPLRVRLALALALASLAGVVWAGVRDYLPSSVAAQTARVGGTEPRSAAPTEPSPQASPPLESGSVEVTGVQPPDALVKLLARSAGDKVQRTLIRQENSTRGTAKFEGVPLGQSLVLRVTAPEHWPEEREIPPLTAENPRCTLERVALQRHSTITVESVPWADVTVNGKPSGKTDAQGKLVLGPFKPGQKLWVDVSRDGFGPKTAKFTAKPGARELPLTLEPLQSSPPPDRGDGPGRRPDDRPEGRTLNPAPEPTWEPQSPQASPTWEP
ncbi:MAG TPA: serine/threonine-protein kinase [Candidatus Nitrosotenuis sp.]|nr:serine/threonine-protein kinase [Candidatus Nitrosotenuis sp.]